MAGWAVDDIETEVADLKARGVVFEEYDLPDLKTVDGIATADPTERPGSRIVRVISWASSNWASFGAVTYATNMMPKEVSLYEEVIAYKPINLTGGFKLSISFSFDEWFSPDLSRFKLIVWPGQADQRKSKIDR